MNISRRDFVVSSLAVAAYSTLARASAKQSIGVQLYTVRDLVKNDLPGTLAAIRKIGFDEVETYWDVYSHAPAELKRIIQDHGLEVHSGHFDYERLDSKLEYAAELGLSYVICPMLPKEMWTSASGFEKAAKQLNAWGEKLKQSRIQFGFHNHNYEFRRFGNRTGFDILLENTDSRLVCLEMDCYWVTQAGQDPVKMLNRLGSRIKMLHMKDRKPGFQPSQDLTPSAEHFAPVGKGTIDWNAIVTAARKTGVERFFAEQDSGEVPPLDDLEISYQTLARVLS